MNRIRLKPKNPNNSTLRAYSQAVKRGSKSLHIVKSDTGWAVKKLGNKRASRVFNTQKQATAYANKRCKTERVSVFIHSIPSY